MKTNRKKSGRLDRRSFIKGAAAFAGAAGFPTIIPSSALGADGAVAPSNRMTMGQIGLGNRGSGNLGTFLTHVEVQVVAVCDVDTDRRESERQGVEKRYAGRKASGQYKGCDGYNEFEELIAREDIDFLSIALPDHWHAIPVIMGARAGKDIYAEKPLALTIAQGRAMSDAVKRHGILFQTGSQQRSDDKFRHACELVRNERIGKLHTVHVGLPGGSAIEAQPEMPVPKGFDYDRWLGPAPWAPYTEKRCHWNFRWILDYSGGQITDWAAHHCDIAQWGMGTTHTGPIEIEGKGEYPRDGLYTAATKYHFDCLYETGVKMRVGSEIRGGVKFEGTDGWVWVNRGEIEAEPKSLLTTVIGPGEIHLYKSEDHHRNFLECVQSRKDPIAPIEEAHRSITIAHLGNICMQLGRKLKWNPQTERFIGDEEADRMLSRAMRAPWTL
ncbi:Gfo/Idh/MocA family oxidoreductase [Candidatus Sumerlaeota bacterium]|nr:Gfo/Idh/MocA family oxidoreductase [Candidatus Sumerlaeota bacterium]